MEQSKISMYQYFENDEIQDNFDFTSTKPGEIVLCHNGKLISKMNQVNSQSWNQITFELEHLNLTSQIEYIQTEVSDFIVACCQENQIVIMGIDKQHYGNQTYFHPCEIKYFSLQKAGSNFTILFHDEQYQLNKTDMLSLAMKKDLIPQRYYFQKILLLALVQEIYLVNRSRHLLIINPETMKVVKRKSLNREQHYTELKVYKPLIFVGNSQGEVLILNSVKLSTLQLIKMDQLEIRSILFMSPNLLVSTESSRIYVLNQHNVRKQIKIGY